MRFKTKKLKDFLKKYGSTTMFCVKCGVSPYEMNIILDDSDNSEKRMGFILKDVSRIAKVMKIDVKDFFED